MTKWAVGINIVGYMPESDLAIFDTRREAVAYASGEAKRIRDNYNECLTYGAVGVTMQRTYPCTKVGRDGDYYIDNADPYHLATHVWVDQISDEDAAQWTEDY
jgi:hypothetical protein